MDSFMHNGTCRGDDAGVMFEILSDIGPTTIEDMGERIGRSVRYVRSLADQCESIDYIMPGPRSLVRDCILTFTCTNCRCPLEAARGPKLCGPCDGENEQ